MVPPGKMAVEDIQVKEGLRAKRRGSVRERAWGNGVNMIKIIIYTYENNIMYN